MAKHWLFVGALVIGGAMAWAYFGPGEHPENAEAANRGRSGSPASATAASKPEAAASAEHASPGELLSESNKVHVSVVRPHKGGLGRTTTQPGFVIADRSATLYAKVSGYLKDLILRDRDGKPKLDADGKPINVDIGTIVEEGDILAKIDMPELVEEVARDKASLERAKAMVAQMAAHIATAKADWKARLEEIQLAKASLEDAKGVLNFREIRHDRIERLVNAEAVEMELLDEQVERRHAARAAVLAAEAGVATAVAKEAAAKAAIEQAEADLKEAEAEVEVRKAALKRAQVDLDYATIRSPYTGVITLRNNFPGDFIRAADQGGMAPLLAVEKTDPMRVVVMVPDKDVPYTKRGDVATMVLDALPGHPFTGKVARMSDVEDPASRTMRVEVDLPNKERVIKTSMFGTVTIHLETASQALTVPSECVTVAGKPENGRSVLYVVVKEGNRPVARKKKVSLGVDDGTNVEVLAGLAADAQVIRQFEGALEDGAPVTVNK